MLGSISTGCDTDGRRARRLWTSRLNEEFGVSSALGSAPVCAMCACSGRARIACWGAGRLGSGAVLWLLWDLRLFVRSAPVRDGRGLHVGAQVGWAPGRCWVAVGGAPVCAMCACSGWARIACWGAGRLGSGAVLGCCGGCACLCDVRQFGPGADCMLGRRRGPRSPLRTPQEPPATVADPRTEAQPACPHPPTRRNPVGPRASPGWQRLQPGQ